MYVILCIRLDICFVVGMVSKYQLNPRPPHWVAVKHILKYIRRTRNYMLIYHCEDLTVAGYTYSTFQLDRDSWKSTSGYVFTLRWGTISWWMLGSLTLLTQLWKLNILRLVKQQMKQFGLRSSSWILVLWVCNSLLLCYFVTTMERLHNLRNHRRWKYIERKYHIIRKIVSQGDVVVSKIPSAKNLEDPFTKTLPQMIFESHLEEMIVKYM